MTEQTPWWHQLGDPVVTRDLILTWQKVNARRQVPQELLDNARLEEVDAVQLAFGDMILSLTSYVLGEKLPDHTVTETGSVSVTASVQCPSTWWQHAKHQYRERWWIRSLARRRPPVMHTETATETKTGTLTATWHQMALYPWAKYVRKVPSDLGLGDTVRLSWLESSRTGGMFR